MLDNNIFIPEKISFANYKMLKGQVETPEDFDNEKVDGHDLINSLEFGFNLEEKMAKTDFIVSIKTKSNGENKIEALGNFHFMYVFNIENLDELAIPNNENEIELHPALANALASITYSTSRGILITRLQGTSFSNFILPVINPTQLLNNI
jgi:hypothetical protein